MAGILIADSGSTKAQWALIGAGEDLSFKTRGINPVVQSAGIIASTLTDELLPQLKDRIPHKIVIYSAGCSTASLSNVVKAEVSKVFAEAETDIHHDLDAAAHALYGDGKGIATILGTGSNSCYYNGFRIIQRVPSLGFILGDEGSGAYLGQLLLRDYYYKRMPEQLAVRMEEDFDVSKDTVFRKVYREPNPNAYLAEYSAFIGQYIDEFEYLKNLVKFSFEQFFDTHMVHYLKEAQGPLGCVGSVGHYFKETLKEVAEERGFNLQKTIQSPLNDLITYYERKNH